jgi:hypothetical protein
MTEEEAMKKWCPMIKAEKNNGIVFTDESNCRGSACMMWRWEAGLGEKIDGYCGLAGKP